MAGIILLKLVSLHIISEKQFAQAQVKIYCGEAISQGIGPHLSYFFSQFDFHPSGKRKRLEGPIYISFIGRF
jgi:hypothetical protein